MGREMQTPGMADLAASFQINPTTHLALMFSSRYQYSSLKTQNNKEQETKKIIPNLSQASPETQTRHFLHAVIQSSVFGPPDLKRQRTRSKTAKAVTK
jgi:hypothetical protein